MDSKIHSIDGRRTIHCHYDTLAEFQADSLEGMNPKWTAAVESFRRNKSSFIGRKFSSWGEIIEAANSAWGDGLDAIEEMIRDIRAAEMPRPKSRRRKRRFDEMDGDEVDLDRLRSGNPYWATTHRENRDGPEDITIVVHVGGNCSQRSMDLLWQGAAAIAATEILEEAGFRVRLIASQRSHHVWASKSGGHFDTDGAVSVVLKNAGDPLDKSTLANAISGWYYRTMYFAHHGHRSPGGYEIKGVCPSLGSNRRPAKEEIEFATQDSSAKIISGCYSKADAIDAACGIIRDMVVLQQKS